MFGHVGRAVAVSGAQRNADSYLAVGLIELLKDAYAGAWSGADIADDRKGRLDLLNTLNELDTAAVAVVLHQQAIDTTTSARCMSFEVTGKFAEFERGMIDKASAP